MIYLLPLVVLDCDRLPTFEQQTQCASAVHAFICWTTESVNISPNDPALLLFRDPGESLESAMVGLADERVNGCEPKGNHKEQTDD